jgi:glucans biosynthesis protein C
MIDKIKGRPEFVAMGSRLYYLDWLRVLSMILVFLYHNNRLYNFGDWHVKNVDLNLASTIFENSLSVWLMPFLFVVSGAAVVYSLKSRSAGLFIKERVFRLFVPLVTVGIFVFGPLQVYLDRFSHGVFTGSFWQFIPQYFNGLWGLGGNFAFQGVHLWYLMLLFIFSLLFLPLFLPSRNSGSSLLSRISNIFNRPWALILLAIPLTLTPHLTNALGMGFTRQMGGWDMFSYMLCFLYGYLIFTSPRIADTLSKYCFIFLIVAVGMTVFELSMVYAVLPTPDSGFFASTELHSINCWFWVLAVLGLGSSYLNANNRFLGYANEAVLPFYILHQPVILAIGFFVVQWNLPIIAKYIFIVGTSFIAIMMLYELLVKRIEALRFIFGMKLSKKIKESVILEGVTQVGS